MKMNSLAFSPDVSLRFVQVTDLRDKKIHLFLGVFTFPLRKGWGSQTVKEACHVQRGEWNVSRLVVSRSSH